MPMLGYVVGPRSAAAVAIVSTVEPVDGSAAVMPERTIEATPGARLHSSTTTALEEAKVVESVLTPSTKMLPPTKWKGTKLGVTVGEGEVDTDCVDEPVVLVVADADTLPLVVAEADTVVDADADADGVTRVQASAAPVSGV